MSSFFFRRIADAIVPDGGQVVTTLPISDELKNRRANVNAEFQLAAEVLDREVSLSSALSARL